MKITQMRFACRSKSDVNWNNEDMVQLDMSGVQGEPYGRYTPVADLRVVVTKEAGAIFEPGKEYIANFQVAE